MMHHLKITSRLARASAGLLAMSLGATGLVWAAPAAADLRVCNGTESSVGVAVGYDDDGELVTEGWWNLSAQGTPTDCATVIMGPLQTRLYYVYAIDYTLGGEWAGEVYMCTQDTEFTIRGVEDCVARGYDRAGFVEIDTGDRTVHNVQLTDQQGIGGE